MRLPTPKQLNLTNLLIGWTLSIAALSVGVAMWRGCQSIDPPPPMGVFISSMMWIFCGMMGIFYNWRVSGFGAAAESKVASTEPKDPLDGALQRLRVLQQQLDQNVITLAEYREERSEILAEMRSQHIQ